jgi:hypothetical protein
MPKYASTAMDDRVHVRLSPNDRHNLDEITAHLEALPGVGSLTPSKALRRALQVAVKALKAGQEVA